MSDRLEVLLSLNVWGLSFVFLNKCFFKWTSHKGQLIDLQKTKDKTIVSKCFEKQTIALVQTKKKSSFDWLQWSIFQSDIFYETYFRNDMIEEFCFVFLYFFCFAWKDRLLNQSLSSNDWLSFWSKKTGFKGFFALVLC